MEYSRIIIPSSLHPDVIVAIFLLKKLGIAKYPGIDKATIEIRQILPENETSNSLHQKGVIVLDLGGGMFDHHKANGTLSELVAQDLGIIADPSIAKLLMYAKRDDEHGIGTISTDQIDRAFGLSGLVSSLNKTVNDCNKIFEILFPVLDAHYIEERKRTTELPQEFEQKLKEGKAEIMELRHKGKKLKLVFLESDNISIGGWLKSGMGLKADVVCLKMSSGYVNILTRQKKMIDLRWLAAYLRSEEAQLRKRVLQAPVHYLMKPEKIIEAPEWYYDRATNSLLNGGINPKGILPTIIPTERIKAILKEALSREIPHSR